MTHTHAQAPSSCVALIDIGNTRMKAGWFDPASGQREHQAVALEHQNIDQLIIWFNQENVKPVRAIGVNVAGASKAQTIEGLFSSAYGVPVHWLKSQEHACEVLNGYTDHTQLGVDRWMAMIGLAQLRPDATTPLLLASFGTATTLDTLCPASINLPTPDDTAYALPAETRDTRWRYEGGLIFPGPGLMRSSLFNNTAQLPDASGMPAAFPTDTHQAIITGIAAAQAGALIRQWHAGLSRYGTPPRVYGTGGGWAAVQDEAQTLLAVVQHQSSVPRQPIEYLASPILDGLACMARELFPG